MDQIKQLFQEWRSLSQQQEGIIFDENNQLAVFRHAHPQVLITSGIHGDESSIIPLLAQQVLSSSELQPFVFIPILSPTAFALHTRHNGQGRDLNRSFGENMVLEEAVAIDKIVQKLAPFELLISFHEDNDATAAYLYEGTHTPYGSKIREWQRKLPELGIELFSGIDDPGDSLCAEFEDGYHHTIPGNDKFRSMFEVWVEHKGYVGRHLTIEVPGKATLEVKKKVIQASLEIFAGK